MREMKDSGVEWLGCMPTDYDTTSIGSLFTIKKDIIGYEPETVLSITQTGVKPKDLTSNEGQNASSYANYQIVNVGDFAMNHMDLLTGWIDISKYEGVTSPDYRVFTLNDKEMCAEFFLRVFQHYYTNRVFFGFGQGVATLGRWRLPAINFKRIGIPVPPIKEQQKIVQAIDENIGKIEELKSNVQKQIEKLKAYKQSLITEVVTKGLDSTVPMKDSGINTIGVIPKHWTMRKFKTLAILCNGKEISSEGGDVPVYGSGGIFKWTNVPLHSGESLLMGRKGTIDNPMLVTGDFWTVDTMFYTSEFKDIIGKYLFYCCKGIINYGYFKSGSVLPSMTQSDINNIFLTYAPMSEQKTIVDYLDEKCAKIDKLIAIKQSKIEKLEQYKRSLIFEYVTGKKEVA